MWTCIKNIWDLISSPATLFCVAAVILIAYMLHTGTNFLNIGRVFSDYKKIFSDAPMHIWIFWGVPALLALSLVRVALVSGTVAESILVFLSILIAAFFAILAILVSQQGFTDTTAQYKVVLKESSTIVLVEIVLCVFALIITLAATILSNHIPEWLQYVISGVDYYLTFVMLLNLLITIKRLKALIDNKK